MHGARHAYSAYTRDAKAVEARLEAYRLAVLKGDAEAAVALFDEDAEVSHGDAPPIAGKGALLEHLRSFAGYRVVEYRLSATSTDTHGDEALQHGTYHQEVTTPQARHLAVDGEFDARWERSDGQTWRLHRLHTQSLERGSGDAARPGSAAAASASR